MRRNPGAWRRSLAHLTARAQTVMGSIFEPNEGRGRRSQARAGGGRTDMRVAKFLSRPLENPKPYHGPTRNRNSRRKRRDRWYAEHPTEPDRVWEIPF
jgi:uncharacterized membrane protein YccC